MGGLKLDFEGIYGIKQSGPWRERGIPDSETGMYMSAGMASGG